MWVKTYSKTYQGLKKNTIWHLWTDINNWPKWHGDLEYCKMEGPFEVGNHFMLRPKGASSFKIEITEIEEGHKFTDCTKFLAPKCMIHIH